MLGCPINCTEFYRNLSISEMLISVLKLTIRWGKAALSAFSIPPISHPRHQYCPYLVAFANHHQYYVQPQNHRQNHYDYGLCL